MASKPPFLALPDAMQELFKPENLPGPGFQRGYVLAILPRYLRQVAGPQLAGAVQQVRFARRDTAGQQLIIAMNSAAARQEMQMQRERLRQRLNERLKAEVIASIRIL